MKLSQLLDFNNIVVQCHNNPDADAIASGFGVVKYLRSHGKNTILVYSGNYLITKSNLKLMIDELNIRIDHIATQAELSRLIGIDDDAKPDLIVTVDCQYGEGNVQQFEAENIAIIDHHQVANSLPELSEVRTEQASCSTVVWDLLRTENVDIDDDEDLSTALYYGLMMDSMSFTELTHHLDMEMRDQLKFNYSKVIKFKNTNITHEELKIAGMALLGSEYYENNRYSLVKTDPCDPNILGLIADMMLEVDDVDSCIVFSVHEGDIKLSVRSCVKEIKANELARFVVGDIGQAGGHITRAGGAIRRSMFEKAGMNYSVSRIHEYLIGRMDAYLGET